MLDALLGDAFFPILTIFAGCCSNVISLEYLVKGDAGAGHLITFAQFVFVAIEGLLTNVERVPYSKGKKSADNPPPFPYRLKPRIIPLWHHAVMVTIFFTTSVMNNKALAFHIALPFHMIFRSGSLIANVIMGSIIFRKRYSFRKVVSVVTVTVGIVMATLASVADVGNNNTLSETSTNAEEDLFWWTVGILILTGALFLSSSLGLFQEYSYTQYGKENYKESMFYSHFLALPLFALVWDDIVVHAKIYSASAIVDVPFLHFSAPAMWLNLFVNVVTQYVCVRGVFTLTGKTNNSLTCTLVLTLRKFISLIFSVLYFNNTFTAQHWVGTFFVFAGTILYSWPEKAKKETPAAPKVEKSKKSKKTEKKKNGEGVKKVNLKEKTK